MASRLCIKSFLLATQLNLGKGVVNEGLIGGEDGAALELVGGVELGALLAKLESLLSASKGSLLADKLAAPDIFLFKEYEFGE